MFMWKENVGAIIKLLLCNMIVMGFYRGNNLLQCMIKLHTINSF